MERRTRVLVACVLFTAALLIGNGRTVLGAIGPVIKTGVGPVSALAQR
jgi:hypothetical protein